MFRGGVVNHFFGFYIAGMLNPVCSFRSSAFSSSVRVFFNGNLIEQLREREPVFKWFSAWIELFKVQY